MKALMQRCLAGFVWVLVASTGLAVNSKEAKDLADDPVAEKRLMAIAAELRCLVCQNESLSASNADLAVDLRREIRTQIKADRSDQQILDFMVERYGDFVRYRPAFKPLTWVLWIGPFLIGLIGLFVLWRRTGRHSGTTAVQGQQDEGAVGSANVGRDATGGQAPNGLTLEQIARANQLLGVAEPAAPPSSPSSPSSPTSQPPTASTPPTAQHPDTK